MPTQSSPTRYLPFMSTFSLLTAGLVHAATRRNPRDASPLEFTEAVLATFFITRVVAHERVGVVLREPFVEPAPGADPHDPAGEAQRPTGDGLRRSAGELLTCTRCLGPWAGGMLTFGRAFAPRHVRILTRVLALAGANSLMHAAHTAVCEIANEKSAH